VPVGWEIEQPNGRGKGIVETASIEQEPAARLRRGTIAVMAVTCGIMVGSVYLCQPLAQMAVDLAVPEQTASLVTVFTQVGYALGILLVVPLADTAEPAKLVRWLMALTALGMVAASAAANIPVLLIACLVFAPLTVVPQILMPLSASLVPASDRGRIVGKLSAGLVCGILLSRTVSGAVAQFTGSWRASYLFASFLTTILFFVVPGFMPKDRPRSDERYLALLRSLPQLLRHRPLLLSMGLNFFIFGAFSAFWSTLAFQGSTPAFGFGPAAAGMFGVWGMPGALSATLTGRLTDRWGSGTVNILGIVFAAASMLVAGTWGLASVVGLIIAVNLLDLGMQSAQITNQTRIFGLGPSIRGRVNTIYMTVSFLGGALGAMAGTAAWTAAGWTGVCVLGGILIAVAASIFLIARLLCFGNDDKAR
jgi:predicted MFS family arabinose efflux permease